MEKKEFSISITGKNNYETMIIYRKDVEVNNTSNIIDAYRFKNDLSTFIINRAKDYYKRVAHNKFKYIPHEVIFSYNGKDTHHELSKIQLFDKNDPFSESLADKIEKFLFEVFSEETITIEEITTKEVIFIVKGNIYAYNSKEKEYYLLSECYGHPTIEEFCDMVFKLSISNPFQISYDQLKISLTYNEGTTKHITIENINLLEKILDAISYLNKVFIEKDILSINTPDLNIRLIKEPKIRKPRKTNKEVL